jgi:hypothetical protein
MNRQRLAGLPLSTLHVQQGLFASLALVATLIGAQQLLHSSHHTTVQTQFRAASSRPAEGGFISLMSTEQRDTTTSEWPREERWVF